ncbi:hypothetical protein [Roseofilum casamattae]|uniref:Uncharacterized protein n=1 Tax=Roseofilum casamattae BLCC-M143 TaxID=3022442 RepID=A0ABT7C372_9CYAN|nr:hypothetical protein [Roseofilum casamattae]MDJ1185912.1 hypothetical protein [Roseofilum casamattae BLCC-M143]
MATARRGDGVSNADRMRAEIAEVLKGDITANYGNLSDKQKKYLEGIYGGTTKIAPRAKRKMTTEQRSKMKISLLPFGTPVPDNNPSGDAAASEYYLSAVTKNTFGLVKECTTEDIGALANWRTAGAFIDNAKTQSFWPAQIKVRYGKLEDDKLKTETTTTYYGQSKEGPIVHSGTVPFGAGVEKLAGTNDKQETEIAASVIEGLKTSQAGYKCLGTQYKAEFFNVSGAAGDEDFNANGGVTPAFT